MSEREFPYAALPREKEVKSGFESRVWHKIAKKKMQRRATVATIGFLVIAGTFLLLEVGRPPVTAGSYAAAAPATVKEEVPLTENLVFAVDDSRNRYSVEPVSYRPPAKSSRTRF